jgi:hypothetical protein
MFEAIVALLILAALLLAALVPPMPLLWVAASLGSLGGLLGVPAGLIYHAKLWRALRAEGQDTAGMWLRPHLLHDKLSEERRELVQRWFAVGVVGFMLTILGAVGVVTAVVRVLSV